MEQSPAGVNIGCIDLHHAIKLRVLLDKLLGAPLPEIPLISTVEVCTSRLPPLPPNVVYAIGQRQLRRTLKQEKAAIKNQLNKLTERPTMRWIFQCFQGIHVVITQGYEQIINLNESRRRILQLLPNSCQKYYFLSESIGAYY